MPANLLTQLPDATRAEIFETLINTAGVKIERIVSHGQVTPGGQWYDQATGEWVLVMQGEAMVEFEGGERFHLRAGDHLNIAAHVRHRVAWTLPGQDTVWLAVHYG